MSPEMSNLCIFETRVVRLSPRHDRQPRLSQMSIDPDDARHRSDAVAAIRSTAPPTARIKDYFEDCTPLTRMKQARGVPHVPHPTTAVRHAVELRTHLAEPEAIVEDLLDREPRRFVLDQLPALKELHQLASGKASAG